MINFFRQTLKKPGTTGAVTPSSPKLARLITEGAKLDTAKFVVELGPGTGVFTTEIIKKFPHLEKFFTVEKNPEFARLMTQKFPGVKTFESSAVDLPTLLLNYGRTSCDRIISGLPWTAFNPKLQQEILEAISNSLEVGGLFLTFAYSPFNKLPNGKNFKESLEQKFRKVEKSKIVTNIPPAFVYICTK